MEPNPNLDEPNVLVNSSDILKKFKSREDRYNFMRENSNYLYNFLDLYLPQEVGFDSYFFLQVLSGSKKVIFIFYNF